MPYSAGLCVEAVAIFIFFAGDSSFKFFAALWRMGLVREAYVRPQECGGFFAFRLV